MKYLKKYKTFKESIDLKTEILEDINDIFIDLKDTEIVKIKINKLYNTMGTSHRLTLWNHIKPFNSNDVIYYIERVVSYLKSRSISNIKISVSIHENRQREQIMKERGFTTPVPTLNLETYKEDIKDLLLEDIMIEFDINNLTNLTNESILIDLEYQRIEDLLESLNIWHDALLTSINAEEVDIFSTFNLPTDMFSDKLDLDFLDDNVEFINSLSSIALKKSELKNSEDFQTFLNKPCKFMFVYDINSNELENPVYLLFQTWNESLTKWEDVKLYKVNDDVKRFYDKLTSRTIEITDGDENYIYSTSNGNEWVLQNSDKENDIYVKTFRKEELQDLVKERNVKINVI
jgi:hypothetical protein